jgi:hypothetical protein
MEDGSSAEGIAPLQRSQGCGTRNFETVQSLSHPPSTYPKLGAQLSTPERQQPGNSRDTQKVRPWWIDGCFIIGGVGCDWYLAFKWFSGRYSFLSPPVLLGMSLVVVLCFSITLIAARVLGEKLREGAAVFWVVSLALLGNMLLWWTTHR